MIAVVDSIQEYLAADSDEDTAQEFMPVLQMIVAAQERGDFLLVADVLEYEVAGLVSATSGT